MRWFKFAFIISVVVFAAYYGIASQMDDSKTYTFTKRIDYPVEKVFPQFNNLQNFKDWNVYFQNEKKYKYSFFTPYEGQDSGLTYSNDQGKHLGDITIKFSMPNKAIRYFWFTANEEYPTIIEVKFKKINSEKTELFYTIKTPKVPILKRPLYQVIDDDFQKIFKDSFVQISNTLGNKVDKEKQLSLLKFDSVMVEQKEAEILLGINVSTSTSNDLLVKNIFMSYNKVKNFLETDLEKSEDEFGQPILISDPNDIKSKERSYYYGFPISKKINITDNNFIYRYLSARKYLIIYYKGDYKNRLKSIQKLQAEAKTQELRTGQLHETFLENPTESGEQTIKIALEILN